jgi:hypothetical protein
MSESTIVQQITEKATKMGYKSVTCRLALIQENEDWKIFNARFVFDIVNPTGQQTIFKKKNFALEDFSLSVEDFYKFLNYLKRVYVGNIKFQGQSFEITEDLLF